MANNRPPSKADVKKWLEQAAENDQDHGRDSESNPNNAPNGKK